MLVRWRRARRGREVGPRTSAPQDPRHSWRARCPARTPLPYLVVKWVTPLWGCFSYLGEGDECPLLSRRSPGCGGSGGSRSQCRGAWAPLAAQDWAAQGQSYNAFLEVGPSDTIPYRMHEHFYDLSSLSPQKYTLSRDTKLFRHTQNWFTFNLDTYWAI